VLRETAVLALSEHHTSGKYSSTLNRISSKEQIRFGMATQCKEVIMILAEFSVVPLDKGTHLSGPIARVLKLVDKSGLDYRLTSMGTIVEGSWQRVMALIQQCHERMMEDSERVITTIKIDDHKGRAGRLTGKVESVEKALGKKLKT
jgi:uncharacterized protein (TIGR00106 family)